MGAFVNVSLWAGGQTLEVHICYRQHKIITAGFMGLI
jgi:hypothetical protein